MAKHEWPDEEQETTAVPVDTDETTTDPEATESDDVSAETAEGTDAEPDASDDDAVAEGEVAEGDVAAADADVTDKVDSADGESSRFAKVLAFGLLPALALLLAAGAGYLKWIDNSVRSADVARIETMQVAKDTTVKMLSYKPDTVEQDLASARDLLTGSFRDDYIKLTEEQVIPGSKQMQISAVASVPAAASVSAKPNRAEVLVFVNQSVITGNSAPTATASSVKVTLDKVGDRWLISAFDPV